MDTDHEQHDNTNSNYEVQSITETDHESPTPEDAQVIKVTEDSDAEPDLSTDLAHLAILHAITVQTRPTLTYQNMPGNVNQVNHMGDLWFQERFKDTTYKDMSTIIR